MRDCPLVITARFSVKTVGAALNSAEVSFDAHGVPSDPAAERNLRTIGEQVVQFALRHNQRVIEAPDPRPTPL